MLHVPAACRGLQRTYLGLLQQLLLCFKGRGRHVPLDSLVLAICVPCQHEVGFDQLFTLCARIVLHQGDCLHV